MRKILLFCFSAFILCSMQVSGQDLTVTGTVSAEDGSVLPGVSIALKGTSRGTTTNGDGKFTFEAPTSGTLVFSFIGFQTQEIPVNNRSVFNVSLKNDISQLQEVVVTALGIKRDSRAVGYSVARVDGSELVRKSEPDPLKSLMGKVAGVDIRSGQGTPGAATKINIRGNTSLFGSNEPLIIVDGIPYNNTQVTTSTLR